MLAMISEDNEGKAQDNTDSLNFIGEAHTFPRVPRKSRCPSSFFRNVDFNQLFEKAKEEDKKVEVTHPFTEEEDENEENRNPSEMGCIDLTGSSRKPTSDMVLDLSKSVEPKGSRRGYTMPMSEVQTPNERRVPRHTPLKLSSAKKTPLTQPQPRFAPIVESPREVPASKSLFGSGPFVYEREVVTHKQIGPSHSRLSGVQPIDYQEMVKVSERYEEPRDYGHSQSSGYYSEPYAPSHHPPPTSSHPVQQAIQQIPSNDGFAVPEPPQRYKPSTKEISVNGKSYQVLALLGKGGSSRVYLVLAKDNSLLAIKCVNLANVDEKIRRDHLNEIEHLMKMQYCKHIIRVIDHQYIPSKNVLCAVMERGDTDLSRILKERTTSGEGVPPEMILFYWSEILLAVKSIHDNNIIHRDLKPANFLLVGGRLKLIDFGIASGIDTEQTSVFKDSQSGTPNYMSPEAWEDLGVGDQRMVKIGRKTDVWSLGCILYTFLYGKTPFQEFNNPMAKFRAITNPNHHIPFPPVTGVPDMLIESCRLCLVYDKNKRASIEDLLVLKSQVHTILLTPQQVIKKLRPVLDDDALEKAREAIEN